METRLQNSKISFLLSTCPKFSQKFYKYILKKYENNKTVATIHNFRLFIKFKQFNENDTIPFSIINTDYTFYNTETHIKNIYSEWLQLKNNETLSKKEMNMLYDNLKLLDINLDIYQFIPILTIATLIKIYKHTYKYLFIPVVIDYNKKNYNVYHQAGLIIDFSGKILFYEPYGRYEKFNKSYKKCITDLLNIYSSFILEPPLLDQNMIEIKCTTFHDYIYSNNLENNNGGIQHYINQINNKHITGQIDINYIDNYNMVINEICEIKNDYYNELNNNEIDILENSINQINKNDLDDINLFDDKTITVVFLLSMLNKINTKNKTTNFIEKFQILYDKVLCLYYNYNSQTCVTITIYELNEFFNTYLTNINKDIFEIEKIQKNNIRLIYDKFSNATEPNHLLLSEISNLVNIYNSNNMNNYKLEKIFKNSNPNTNTCNKFN